MSREGGAIITLEFDSESLHKSCCHRTNNFVTIDKNNIKCMYCVLDDTRKEDIITYYPHYTSFTLNNRNHWRLYICEYFNYFVT